MTDISKKWVDAAIKFDKNKNEQILCPSCCKSLLRVKDEPNTERKKIDRYIYCDSCRQSNVMTGNFLDSDFYFSEDEETL